jgi:hypothetical protein
MSKYQHLDPCCRYNGSLAHRPSSSRKIASAAAIATRATLNSRLGETVLPNATKSGASITRNTRFWEVGDFLNGNAPLAAKEAFEKEWG